MIIYLEMYGTPPPKGNRSNGSTNSMKAAHGDLMSPDKATEAYVRIRSALNRHQAAPGTFFNIRSLAARMRLSSTPLREALIRLVYEEVIGFVPGRGYYVKPLDLDDVRADYELTFAMLRFAIETSVNSFNLRRMPRSPDHGTDFENQDGEVIAEACAAYIEAFNEHVALLAGNGRLARAVRQFNDRTRPVRLFALMLEPKPTDALGDLSAVGAALSIGARGRALAMLDLRNQQTIARLPDVVKALNLCAQQGQMPLEDLV